MIWRPAPKQIVRGLEKLAWAGLVAIVASTASTGLGASMALDADTDELAPMHAKLRAGSEPDDDDDDERRLGRREEPTSGSAEGKHLARTIVENNPFCPTCKPVENTPSTPAGPALSELPLDLVATFESSDPAYSMATIHDTETGVLGPFEVGEPIRPGVLLHSVERGRVLLRAGQQLSILELPKPEDRRKRKPKAKKKSTRKKRKNPRAIPGADDAIECKKDHCTVQREFVDKLIAKPSLLSKQARIVPAIKNGETQGFKFYGIRRGSLPRLLGVKNGDLLMAVNGMDLDSMDRAMDLYTKLRRANHLSVRIKRKGKIVTKEIQID